MHEIIEKILRFKDNFLASEILNEDTIKSPSLIDSINKAKEEWLDAKNLFQEVTDPFLIDHAIFRMESAERKYMYLLKLANEEKVINNKYDLN